MSRKSSTTAAAVTTIIAAAADTSIQEQTIVNTAATDTSSTAPATDTAPPAGLSLDAGNALAAFGECLRDTIIMSRWSELFGADFPVDVIGRMKLDAMPGNLVETFNAEVARRDGMREFFATLNEGVTITGTCYGRTVLGEVVKIVRGQGRYGTTTATVEALDGTTEALDWKSRGITGLRIARLGEIKALILRVERESAAAAAAAPVEHVSTQTDAAAEVAPAKAKGGRKAKDAAPGLNLG